MEPLKYFRGFIFLLPLLIGTLSACKTETPIPPTVKIASPTDTMLPPTVTQPSPTETSSPSATTPPTLTHTPTLPPTATTTNTASPTRTSTPTPTQTPTITPTATIAPTDDYSWYGILIYFIHVGTGGPVACGDNLIGLGTGIAPTGDIALDIEHALNALFSAGQYSGELYNATYRSSLKASADILPNGKINIVLSGTFVKPDNDCDIMRYREQVWQTVRQIAQGKDFDIYIGPKLLGDRLYTGN